MHGESETAGRFIVFEGGEGTGKTTQLDALAAALRDEGRDVLTTREPGGTPLGEAIRAVLMGEYDAPPPAMSELLLVFAARAAHLAQVVEPALTRGTWVLCDRFTDASYAYQGAARGLGNQAVKTLESLVQGERRPDRVLVLDLPVAHAVERARTRGVGNRFDHETLAFHERVRTTYLERAAAAPERYRVIDAAAASHAVAAAIRRALL